MKLLESEFAEKMTGRISLSFVDIFFFKNLALSEIREGTILTVDKMEYMTATITEHMGPQNKFHYISNRVNAYNCVPTDLTQIHSLFEKVYSVNIVAYGDFGVQTAEFEKPFWPVEINIFKSLQEAFTRVNNTAAA
ncbi:hypothetical protein [Croceiramulus getboli]|nr:hypothetical protein P8624_10300 [Flavobacteriaceae bacterium YJPT1-3]